MREREGGRERDTMKEREGGRERDTMREREGERDSERGRGTVRQTDRQIDVHMTYVMQYFHFENSFE